MTRIALTVDTEHNDHPARPGNTALVVDAFEQTGARGTFFLQGRWVRANPALARRIAEAGHCIGNHSRSHAPMDMMTDEGIADSLATAEEMIVDATGINPRPLFRCPYGAGAEDPRVLAAIDLAGYRDVRWDIDTHDWEPGRTPADIITAVVEGHARHGDGAIVLMHGWPDPTHTALPELIDRLRRGGAELVGVDDLA